MKKLALLFHSIIVLFLAGMQLTIAQSFPVQVIPQALPPAPINFSDYADESTVTSPLRVQLILNDLQVASKEVRLKASFEGNGIAFESNAVVSGAPLLFLESGIPLNLTNVELSPYFKFENIVGISPNVYGQPIPEGTYRFCFEVFDAFSGNRISDRTCAGTIIFQNDPPILIAPLNKSVVEERNPQNIVFQWTPRHINVSNVEYELSIVEIWDNQIDHQAAFLSSPPIFQTTTTATTYLYGPADPQLLSDKNYAWRVQAKAKQGAEEIGLFKNQGYSTIFVFGNTGNCDLPIGINHEVKGSTNANIFWDDITSDAPEFQVRYRQTGGNYDWFYSKTTANLVTLWDLQAGTEYEYQLAKTCALAESEYSPIKTFRTNLFDDDDSAYECGIAPDIDVTNETPLANLNTGEKFTAGDFPVTITEVNGSDGYFNGKGYVTIPYLKSIKVAVEFTNIFINELRELKQGNVITVFDPNMSGIIDPWGFVNDVDGIINGGDSVVLPPVDFEIESVTVSGDKIIITGVDSGNNPVTVEYEYDENDTYIVTGENTAYSIDENGNVNEIGPMDSDGPATVENTTGLQSGGNGTTDNPSVATIDDSKIQIKYLEKSNAKYGFDHQNSPYEADTYTKAALKSGGDFFPIHKAVKNGETDSFIIEVTLTDAYLKLEDLIFKTVSGIKIETTAVSGKANQLQVNLTGAGGYRNEEAIITYKDEEEQHIIVGSFFVHHLRPVGKIDVEVITVNGASMPSGLSNIAQKFVAAGADINVTAGQNFQGNASTLSYTDSGLLRKLPDSFRAFANDFKNNSGNYSRNKYYVFVFDNSVDPGNIAGFMPRGTQYGFVFSKNINTNIPESKKTVQDVITHELGHGVFGISHPYNENNDPEDDGLKTDWAMDKGAGNQLAKRDWEAIGDKGLQLYLFDDDEDGEIVTVINVEELKGWEYNDVGYAFLSPAGEVVLLPKEVKRLKFSTGDLINYEDKSVRILMPFGVLWSFSIDGKDFNACSTASSKKPIGYNTDCKKGTELYKATDYITLDKLNKPLNHVIVGTPHIKDGGFLYKMYQVENTFTDIEEIKQTTYTSGGTRKEFDFIINDLVDNGNTKLLSAPPTFAVNRSAVDFVNYYLNLEDIFKGDDTYHAYLYAHATLLDNHNLLSSCFATGLPGNFLRNVEKYEELVFASDPAYGSFRHRISFPPNFELENRKTVYAHLMSRWSEIDINYYKELQDLIEYSKGLVIPGEVTNENIKYVLDLFDPYLESSNTDNFDCVFSELTVENKRNILKLLLSTDKDDFGARLEKLLVKIFETLKEEDLEKVFEDLKSDPKFIYNGYHKLNDWFQGRFMDAFIYSLLVNWQNANKDFDFASIYPELNNINTENITSDDYRNLINHERVFFLEDEKLFTGTPSDLIIETNWYSNTKRLRIFQDKDVFNSYGKVLAGPLGPVIESVFDPEGPNKLMENLHPLDPVVIYISEQEAKDLKLQLQPGIYAVPAVLLHWVHENQQGEVAAFYTRIALNAVAILLAPFTGGGSVALVTLEVGLATTDIVLTITAAQLGMSNEKFQTFYKYWDNLYTAYGVTLAGVGLFKAAPSLARGSAQLIASAQQARGMLNIAKLKNLEGFRNLSRDEFYSKMRELANKMDEMGSAMVKNTKSQWKNYGHELKRFALSIRLNMELKYVSAYDDLVGHVNPQNKFMLSTGGASSSVFTYSFRNNLHDISQIRYLRSFSNVYNVKFAGQIDNVRYIDKGEELQRIILVEDINNPNSFFAVTTKDIDEGISHVANFDDLRNNYRLFNGVPNPIAKYPRIDKLPPSIKSKLDNWSDELKGKLDDSLLKYANLADELIQNPKLVDHFSEMHSKWYYKLGLARAYKVSKSSNGSIDLPENFVKVLGDLELPNNQKLSEILSSSQFGSKLGNILEDQLEIILVRAWSNKRKGIIDADLPLPLKNHYLSIYDAGYTHMSKQITVKVPNLFGVRREPKPDFLFFKTKNNGKELDVDDVLYDDSKISIYSDFSDAQKAINQQIQTSIGAGKATFQVEAGRVGDFVLEQDGQITIKTVSKLGTSVDQNGLINLERKVAVHNPN